MGGAMVAKDDSYTRVVADCICVIERVAEPK